MRSRTIDLAIIGGGPAGLAAAIKAYELGIKDIIIFERDNKLGGILPQCIHNGFGLHYYGEELTGPEFVYRQIEKLSQYKIDIKLNTMVIKVNKEKKIIAVNSQEGTMEYNAKAIIFAVGCRERTRNAILIPGSRPAGIYTAGTAQRLINIEGYLPGREIVILGSGDVGLIMARRFTLEGAKVKAVVEIMKYPGGLARNITQCLEDFGIPLLLEHTIVNIEGKERVKSVTIAKVDDSWIPIPGTEQKITCDTVVLSVGLIPENELVREAQIEINPETGGAYVNEWMETSVPGIFECGNSLAVFDLVDYVAENAERAAEGAYRYIKEEQNPQNITVSHDDSVRFVIPNKVSGKVSNRFYLRARKPMEKVILEIPEISLRVKYDHVTPSEMLSIKLRDKLIQRAKDKLTFRIKRQEENP